MHEYIEVAFYRKGKPFRVARQVERGFEFDEPDRPVRTIAIGVTPFDDGTRYRMQRIRAVKGWPAERFDIKMSVEDGVLVLRGDDRYSLPEGWYVVSASVSGARVSKVHSRRVEVKHDGHGRQQIDLEIDERTIDVDIATADAEIARVVAASTIDGQSGADWLRNPDVRPTRRACALNLLAVLRVTPSKSQPLITDVDCLYAGKDDRCYARVAPAFYTRVLALADAQESKVYAEGPPHARIHEELLPTIVEFDGAAAGCFGASELWSFRAEGRPSLQMVIARPIKAFPQEFADLDLDLGNPLQDVAGFVIHIGELLDGKPTNHLDLWKKLRDQKGTAPFLYYVVAEGAAAAMRGLRRAVRKTVPARKRPAASRRPRRRRG